MLTALQRYEFDVRGYALIDDVLRPRDVAAARAELAAQNLPPPGDTIGDQRFGGGGAMLTYGPAVRGLLDHRAAMAYVRELIGPYARLDHAYGIMMRPHTSGLGLHGPAWPWDPAQHYVHRGGEMRSGLLSCAWSLVDGQRGDGGFGCIPGSHRADEPVPPGADRMVVEIAQPAGSLLVFTEALAHCTIPWRGGADRYVLMFKYSPGSSAWAHEPLGDEIASLLSARARHLLQPPSVGGHQPSLP